MFLSAACYRNRGSLPLERSISSNSGSLVRFLLCSVLVLMLVSSECAVFLAKAESVSNSFGTDSWQVKYSLSSNAAEPSSSLSLEMEIHAIKTSYSFQLWVSPAAPLSVERQGSNDNHIEYAQLSQGDVRLETFVITVPATVTVGEVYSISLKAQSYASAPLLLGVPASPWPDFQFDTSNNPAKSISIAIVGVPRLAIGQVSYQNSVAVGDIVTVSVPVHNVGTGTAKAANLKVTLSKGLLLNTISGFTNGSDIPPGGRIQVIMGLQAIEQGVQSVQLKLASQGVQPAERSFSVEVKAPPGESLAHFLSSSWWILAAVLIVLVVLGVAFYRRQEAW